MSSPSPNHDPVAAELVRRSQFYGPTTYVAPFTEFQNNFSALMMGERADSELVYMSYTCGFPTSWGFEYKRPVPEDMKNALQLIYEAYASNNFFADTPSLNQAFADVKQYIVSDVIGEDYKFGVDTPPASFPATPDSVERNFCSLRLKGVPFMEVRSRDADKYSTYRGLPFIVHVLVTYVAPARFCIGYRIVAKDANHDAILRTPPRWLLGVWQVIERTGAQTKEAMEEALATFFRRLVQQPSYDCSTGARKRLPRK